ncbi:sortase-associated OmpA-like protein PdsO [Algicola sagamiensis]|uniref:sortase-associated OmpA-like protein PdsO n=1 Tax=Algicola sagamiensis TaxID=163869 RepID=UPI000360FE9F|nr:sortase-associated OmpA-like protein PdsO [Algicola sagamiensis]
MKKQAISLALMATLLSPISQAAEGKDRQPYPEEGVGVGAGVVIGALIAGPAGAVIAGITGGLIGNSVGAKDEVASLNTQLDHKAQQLVAMESSYEHQLTIAKQQLQDSYRLAQVQQPESGNEQTLEMNIQFRTGSSAIEPLYQGQLEAIAEAMMQAKETQLDLSGFSDRRGEADFNLQLSQERAENVKNYLVSLGVPDERIVINAFGDAKPMESHESFETNFFDRRVTLTLQSSQSNEQVASTEIVE